MELAKTGRDEQEAYYKLFGIESGVLYDKQKEKNFFFGFGNVHKLPDKDSDNSAGFNIEVFHKPIVYSTNSNFEFVFLHGLFKGKPIREAIRPYSDSVVIVDEVDNMLLDQAMSPAMICK